MAVPAFLVKPWWFFKYIFIFSLLCSNVYKKNTKLNINGPDGTYIDANSKNIYFVFPSFIEIEIFNKKRFLQFENGLQNETATVSSGWYMDGKRGPEMYNCQYDIDKSYIAQTLGISPDK